MTLGIVISLIWIISGIVSCGLIIGYDREEFLNLGNNKTQLILSFLLGVVSLITSLIVYRPYKFSLKPITEEEAWEAHQEKYPDTGLLSRKLFELFWNR